MKLSKNLIEAIILFLVLFFPGFISQGTRPFDPEIFNNIQFIVIYIITTIPGILLIFYMISNKSGNSLSNFGLKKPILTDFLQGIGVSGLLLLILFASALITQLISGPNSELFQNPIRWHIRKPTLLPLVLLLSLVIGTYEELFFRNYLITIFEQEGLKPAAVIASTSLLFALGHIYQGLPGFLGTFILGASLGTIYLYIRNLVPIAVAHGLYNFTVLYLSTILPKDDPNLTVIISRVKDLCL